MPEKEFFALLGKIASEIDDGEKLLICKSISKVYYLIPRSPQIFDSLKVDSDAALLPS